MDWKITNHRDYIDAKSIRLSENMWEERRAPGAVDSGIKQRGGVSEMGKARSVAS